MRGRHVRRTIPATIGWALGLTGTAVAAFLVAISLGGSVSTANFEVFATTANTQTVSGTCAVSQSGGGFEIAWADAIAGDSCVVALGHEAAPTNGTTATLESVVLATNGELAVSHDCASLTPGQAGTAQVTLSVSADANPGQAYDLSGSVLEWVPASLATC